MSKKNKKKKDTYEAAKKQIKVLKSGKVKINGKKFKFMPYVEESLKESVVSKLDGIISQEEVTINITNPTSITSMLSTIERVLDINRGIFAEPNTVVTVLDKKDALDFDFMETGIIGKLLRTSTLGLCYSKLREQWQELNHGDNSPYTNVMFIPKIFVFVDDERGVMIDNPYVINLLIVAPPDRKRMSDIEDVTKDEAVQRIINDVFDSVCKVGVHHVIINPFSHDVLTDDPYYTAKTWCSYTGTQRVNEHIDTIDFVNENEHDYIIFRSANSNV